MVGYTGLRKNSRNNLGRDNILGRVLIDNMFVYHIVDPGLMVEILFEKEGPVSLDLHFHPLIIEFF